jgi:hypothetical protein
MHLLEKIHKTNIKKFKLCNEFLHVYPNILQAFGKRTIYVAHAKTICHVNIPVDTSNLLFYIGQKNILFQNRMYELECLDIIHNFISDFLNI